MAQTWYTRGRERAEDFRDATTVNMMLLKSTHTFNPDHDFVADLVADEADATGYAREAVVTRSISYDDTANLARLLCADLDFGLVGGALNNTLNAFAVFVQVTNDADSYLLFYGSFAAITTDGTNVTVDVDGTNGIATLA